jgi:translation initiation factor IF-2
MTRKKTSQHLSSGKTKIIATFKSSRKGAIIGCEVIQGRLEMGKNFRIITAMGPAYAGKISSLQIERKNVKLGKTGQQVGIKIPDWGKGKVGDLVECFKTIQPSDNAPRKPRSGIFRLKS